jgi:DNA-binding NtrC family response regulator
MFRSSASGPPRFAVGGGANGQRDPRPSVPGTIARAAGAAPSAPEAVVLGAVTNPHRGSETPRAVGYHGAVSEFKRRLLEATLHQASGNRTHAARALGLQRTYLLRLIRQFGVDVPRPGSR